MLYVHVYAKTVTDRLYKPMYAYYNEIIFLIDELLYKQHNSSMQTSSKETKKNKKRDQICK